MSEFTDDLIDKMVDAYMKEHNLKFVPDSIEHKIYAMILSAILKELQSFIDKISIKVPGFKLKIQLVPDTD